MARDDGGPAFPAIIPIEHSDIQGKDYANFDMSGMSLRDWFAGQVIASCLSATADWSIGNETDAARVAYIIADAMMRERKK